MLPREEFRFHSPVWALKWRSQPPVKTFRGYHNVIIVALSAELWS
jgi:hypothetical protein